jgi:hypothetical protein
MLEASEDIPDDALRRSTADDVSDEAWSRLMFSAGMRSDPMSFRVWVMLPLSIPGSSKGESMADMTKSMSLISQPKSVSSGNMLVSPSMEKRFESVANILSGLGEGGTLRLGGVLR